MHKTEFMTNYQVHSVHSFKLERDKTYFLPQYTFFPCGLLSCFRTTVPRTAVYLAENYIYEKGPQYLVLLLKNLELINE